MPRLREPQVDFPSIPNALRRLDADEGAIAALQAALGGLRFKAGVNTLRTADVREVPVGFDMTVGTYAVLLSRNTLGSGLGTGEPYADPAEYTTTAFYVRSIDPSDDGEFSWLVVKIT